MTGAWAVPSDNVASVGLDSLNTLRLLTMLRQAFPGAKLTDMLLMSNPTVVDLAMQIEASQGPRLQRFLGVCV